MVKKGVLFGGPKKVPVFWGTFHNPPPPNATRTIQKISIPLGKACSSPLFAVAGIKQVMGTLNNCFLSVFICPGFILPDSLEQRVEIWERVIREKFAQV